MCYHCIDVAPMNSCVARFLVLLLHLGWFSTAAGRLGRNPATITHHKLLQNVSVFDDQIIHDAYLICFAKHVGNATAKAEKLLSDCCPNAKIVRTFPVLDAVAITKLNQSELRRVLDDSDVLFAEAVRRSTRDRKLISHIRRTTSYKIKPCKPIRRGVSIQLTVIAINSITTT